MNISARCEYALRAMVELGLRYDGRETVNAGAIAEKGIIPEKYLVHILLQLKRNGLVRSVRGAQGGYILDRSPEAISLFDIVTAIDGPILDPLPGETPGRRELGLVWQEAGAGIADVLRAYTLQGILDNLSTSDMYYI